MNNKGKYEGKIVNIYAPFGGRKLDTLSVEQVQGENLDILYGTSKVSGIKTAYYLSDGLSIEIIEIEPMRCDCGAVMTKGYIWDTMKEPKMAEDKLPKDMTDVEGYFEEYDCPECGEGLIIAYDKVDGVFKESWRDNR